MLLDNYKKQSPIVGVAGLGGGINSYIFLSSGGDYVISKSLRFNSDDAAYLSRTATATGNRRTWTWSNWIKRSKLGSEQFLLKSDVSGSNARDAIRFEAGDTLRVFFNGTNGGDLVTTQVFRDSSAWYHLVIAVDTTQATSANRVKIYINGSQITDFSTETYPTQNYDTGTFVSGKDSTIANDQNSNYLNGYLADVHFVDGQQLSPTDFGKTDDDGVWQPKKFSGSYGTNGFHLDFKDNSSNAALGYDAAGSNNWTVLNLKATASTLPGVLLSPNSGSFLSLASSSDFEYGTGDFTWEFYVKRPRGAGGYVIDHGSNGGVVQVISGAKMGYYNSSTATGGALYQTGFGDVPAEVWTHLAVVRQSGTTKLYKNGTQTASQGDNHNYGQQSVRIGQYGGGGNNYWGGGISNVRIVKGTAVYTSNFTRPATPLANVNNTELLCCQSSSSASAATVTPGTITVNGTVTPGEYTEDSLGIDSLVDTPTNGDVTDDTGSGGQITGNFATLNALNADNQGTLSNGNLDVTGTPGFHGISNMGMSSGKWYAEVTGLAGGGASNYLVGVCDITQLDNSNVWDAFTRGYGYRNDSKKINSNNASTYGDTYSIDDVIGIAFDYDNGTLEFYKNGVSQGTAFSGISRAVNSGTVGVVRYFFASFCRTSSDKINWNFGQRPFAHTAPSGFKTLCTSNLSQSINNPSEYFDTKLFTGNGGTQSIAGLNFSPSFVWIKQKNATRDHILLDVVRGANKVLYSNLSSRDDTYTNTLTSFDSNGFTLGGNNLSNINTGQYVSWAWNAGSTTASNSDGDITSQVRASQSSGFSIVKYTGVGGSRKAIGHGLNNKPKFIFIKRIDASADWPSYILSHTTYFLNTTAGSINDDDYFHGDYKPTTSVFTVGTNASVNADGGEYIAYVWAPVEGYSEMGQFNGNSNANGVFQYTGFKVKWLLMKRNGTKSWQLIDAARSPFNVTDDRLFPDDTGAESTSTNFNLDFVSNGFKCRVNHDSTNTGLQTWMAFAEHPFKTARAR